MADEDPWGDVEETPAPAAGTPKKTTPTPPSSKPGSKPASKAASPGGSKAGSKAGSAQGSRAPSERGSVAGEAGEGQPPPPPPDDDKYRKPVQLYRHWVRPKFLQYRYMYNYRTNYYDDVIDYLDKKQKGENREIPRPQTWAERVLRVQHTGPRSFDDYGVHKPESLRLVTLPAVIRTYNYHTKAYVNQRYARIL
ncbi:fln family protein [Megaselia abdita]